MTNNAIGQHTRGRVVEDALLNTEQAITLTPVRALLCRIAMDAFAATLRNDAAAIENLSPFVDFRAVPLRSKRRPGQARVFVMAKGQDAWGHYMSGPLSPQRAVEVAIIINGPAPSKPAIRPASRWAVPLGVFGRGGTTRSKCQPSAAAGIPPVRVQEQSNAPTESLNCASLSAA